MGARLLRSWILRPEIDLEEITARLDAVGELKDHTRCCARRFCRNLQAAFRISNASPAAPLWVSPRRAIWQLCASRWRASRCSLRRFLENCTGVPLESART